MMISEQVVIRTLTQEPRPHTVMEWLFAMLVQPIHAIAQECGLFRVLDNSAHDDVTLLAKSLEFSERGVRCMLDCLVAAGIITPTQRGYQQVISDTLDCFEQTAQATQALVRAIDNNLFHQAVHGILPASAPLELTQLGITRTVGAQQILTPAGQHYFTPGQDQYLGGCVRDVWRLLNKLVPLLPQIFKTGQPGLRAQDYPSFFAPLVETLFPMSYEVAQQIAEQVAPLDQFHHALDLGAGSAVWSIALAQRQPALQIDALDLPRVLYTTKSFTERYGVQDQYHFLPGDFMTQSRWGKGTYDLILLGDQCSCFSDAENQALLLACAAHLRPGGYLLLTDYVPQPDRQGPFLDVFFSVLMLSFTVQGDTYSLTTYEEWCRNAGLNDLKWLSADATSTPILLARKSPLHLSVSTHPHQAEIESAAKALLETEAAVNSEPPAEETVEDAGKLVRFEQETTVATHNVASTLITETSFAFARSCILLAAIELHLFTYIAHGLTSCETLAQRTGTSARALARLLDALVALGFLRHLTSEYTLTPVSQRYLVSSNPEYIGDTTLQLRQEWDTWIHLSDIIRSGQAARFTNEEPLGGRFYGPQARQLFPATYALMKKIYARLEIGEHAHGLRMLDLGAGAAPAAIAALELDPQAQAIVVDFHQVLQQAQEFAQEHGVASRIEYCAADLTGLDLPAAQFDLVVASQVLHVVGPEQAQRLLLQCARTLKPGGKLVIVEAYKWEETQQAEQLFPYILSLDMLINTRRGDAFTCGQMYQWLQAAHLAVETWSDLGPEPIIIATRRPGGTHTTRSLLR